MTRVSFPWVLESREMKIAPFLALVMIAVPALNGCGSVMNKVTGSSAEVTLKRTYKEGDVSKFVQTTSMKMSMPNGPSGAGDFTMTADVTRTNGKVDSTGAVDTVILTNNMKMEGAAAAAAQSMLPKEVKLNAHIDSQSMMKMSIDPSQKDSSAISMVKGMMGGALDKPMPDGVQLPTKPVKAGDTWTTPYTQLEALGATGETKQTFLGETSFGGKQAFHITSEGHFELGKSAPKDTSTAMAQALSKMQGTVDLTTDVYLDPKDCSLLSSKTTTKTKMSMPTAPKGGDLTQEMMIELKKVS